MNALPGIKPHAIFEATEAARTILENCSSIEALMYDEWAENRLLDFNLWAAGVGASSTSASSLDERLFSQPAVRTVILGLLSTLEAFVQSCIELGMAHLHYT